MRKITEYYPSAKIVTHLHGTQARPFLSVLWY